MKEKENKTSVIKNNLYFLKLIWKIDPASIYTFLISQLIGYGNWVFWSVILCNIFSATKTECEALKRL